MIDWDKAFSEAESSPRAVLTEALDSIDRVSNVVLVMEDTEGKIAVWFTSEDTYKLAGMLSLALHKISRESLEE